MRNFGQLDQTKSDLSSRLIAIEKSRNSAPALTTLQQSKALLEELRATSRWDDSRSGITASVQSLFKDEDVRPYLKYTDISARANALIVWAAGQVTESQAQAEGVAYLRRVSDAESYLEQTQRLSQPGGEVWETARETPEPFVEEAVRRGVQVKRVGGEVADKVAPVGQGLVDQLDEKGITNPLLGVVSLGLFVFMERKLLAILIIIALIYLTKQRQINTVKQKVQAVQDSITSTVDKVSGAAEAVQNTAERFN